MCTFFRVPSCVQKTRLTNESEVSFPSNRRISASYAGGGAGRPKACCLLGLKTTALSWVPSPTRPVVPYDSYGQQASPATELTRMDVVGCTDRSSYLRSGWNVLDFCIVFLSLISLFRTLPAPPPTPYSSLALDAAQLDPTPICHRLYPGVRYPHTRYPHTYNGPFLRPFDMKLLAGFLTDGYSSRRRTGTFN